MTQDDGEWRFYISIFYILHSYFTFLFPHSVIFVYFFYIKLSSFIGIFHVYFACLVTRCLDVEVKSGARAGVPAMCRIMFSTINGQHSNLDEFTVAESRLNIFLL